MATKKAKTTYPKVTVGTHLTVTEHEDGRTELTWDDEQLLKEVREAIASLEKKVKKTKKPKEILNSVEVSMDVIEKAKKSSKKAVVTTTKKKKASK